MFVGESFSPWFVEVLTSFPTYTQIRYRGGEAGVAAAGDDAVLPFVHFDQLEVDSVAEFALVLVGVSGSAQVRVTYGFDPAWDATAAACTISAGTVTVGAGEVVVPLPGWTVAEYVEMWDEPVVRLEVLSGSVVLDQVRLRIWPPGGPLGGYGPVVEAPPVLGPYPAELVKYQRPIVTDFSSRPPGMSPFTDQRIFVDADEGPQDLELALLEAQGYARTDLANAGGGPADVLTASVGSGPYASEIIRAGGRGLARDEGLVGGTTPSGAEAFATVSWERVWLHRVPVQGSPAGVYGEDWVSHPDRVPGEPGAGVELFGAPEVSWAYSRVTIAATSSMSSGLPDGTRVGYHLAGTYKLNVYGAPALPTDAELAAEFVNPIAGTGVPRLSVPGVLRPPAPTAWVDEFDLPEVDGPVVIFELHHDIHWASLPSVEAYDSPDPLHPSHNTGAGSAVVYAGTFEVFDEDSGIRTGLQRITYWSQPAPYRVWVPAGSEEEILQWKQRSDGKGLATAPSWRSAQATQRGLQWRGPV